MEKVLLIRSKAYKLLKPLTTKTERGDPYSVYGIGIGIETRMTSLLGAAKKAGPSHLKVVDVWTRSRDTKWHREGPQHHLKLTCL